MMFFGIMFPMVTLILPGGSSKNKAWLEETAGKIPGDGEIRPIYWGHWDDPDIKFDPKVKANLLDSVSGKRVVDIVAKSVGTLVASYLIQKSPEKIRKVIFCGIPLNDLSEEDKNTIKDALDKIAPENFICFQNEKDPHAEFGEVEKNLSEVSGDLKIISKPRVDHEYPYYEDFNKFLEG